MAANTAGVIECVKRLGKAKDVVTQYVRRQMIDCHGHYVRNLENTDSKFTFKRLRHNQDRVDGCSNHQLSPACILRESEFHSNVAA
jgi:hypothetical protein